MRFRSQKAEKLALTGALEPCCSALRSTTKLFDLLGGFQGEQCKTLDQRYVFNSRRGRFTFLIHRGVAARDSRSDHKRARRTQRHATGGEGIKSREGYPELRRYRAAGARGASRYHFPRHDVDTDAFFMTESMSDYAQGVVIEGDRPVEYVDLTVFVASPVPECCGHRW